MNREALTESLFLGERDESSEKLAIGELLRRQAVQHGDTIALKEIRPSWELGRSWSYAQLLADAERLGRALAALHRAPPPEGAGRFGWRRDNMIGGTPQRNAWSGHAGVDGWVQFYGRERLGAMRARLAAAGPEHTALCDAVRLLVAVLPRFFEGKLPDLNLGTANGASCHPALAQTLLGIATSAPGYTGVLNGRFKGGHITRHYGDPARGIHAVQLEMTQSSYMQEQLPFDYLPDVAAGVQPHVRRMLEAVLAFVEH